MVDFKKASAVTRIADKIGEALLRAGVRLGANDLSLVRRVLYKELYAVDSVSGTEPDACPVGSGDKLRSGHDD